ncbi:MAG TPA: nucleotidyl transferase AbiEii/AbiGii toxin family protein [Mycobacteriales bacterium]|jgi:predicted nucleotidyltransferase component of viral defense system|nr:nucleotidyl transferase AbiEii/AbiGii toxin family protein [Mycobacteriales bacterium]
MGRFDVLDPTELRDVAAAFGVYEDQVLRDHLISHLLAAISAEAARDVVFFGGTALARSVVPDGRLSEDIDLLAIGRRSEIAARLTATLPRALRREFPSLSWDPALTEVREPAPAILRSADGLVVRVQLLSATGYPPWPTEEVDLVQRYLDVPPARFVVPTAPGFAAAKAVAWYDRRASRDLWDLWALAERGHVDREAAHLYARLGPTNRTPNPEDYATPPDQAQWDRDLGAQIRLTVTAAEAAEVVAEAWCRAID